MRVVSKFAFAFFVASCLCLGVYSYVLANREAARLERTLVDELVGFGSGLDDAVETSWRDRGLDGARSTLAGFEAESDVVVRFSPDTTIPRRTTRIEDAGERRQVTVLFPVRGPNGKTGVLSLERDVASGAALIRDELGAQLLAALALALVMALIAAVLGAIVIGRPLDRIVTQARRIGAGDLSARLKTTGADEIGVLKRELNTMCDRLAEAYDQLEEEAAARLETLEQLRHLDRLRTVGTIASSIAHELGTPLNVLLLRGQSLASSEVSPDEVVDSGRAIVSQVQKMSSIVRQLLDFTRARKGGASRFAETDLAKVATHARELLLGVARKHRVELVVDAPGPVRVKGDFEQLEQAMTNLIVNAIHAMPRGGDIIVRVRADQEDVEKEPTATVEIIDQGEGMTEDVIAHIFEPFFTTKGVGDGTGLGLHVTRGILSDHGGSISVTSEPGKGSAFSLRLPRLP